METAVEGLVDWMSANQYFIGNDLLKAVEQAKEMEKEQIITAYKLGLNTGLELQKEIKTFEK
jgi:hypothetical protein